MLTASWILKGNYTFEELYGSTYGSPLLPMGLGGINSFQSSLKCAHIPNVFVHGFGGVTADYEPLKLNWMLLGGYRDEELYGTTYGIPAIPMFSLMAYHTGVSCIYVKGVRNLIIAVSEYTNSTVNVLGYSMGGPVSRKAILGGKCVDTGEDLGPPLTDIVENYLGVAGAMRGAILCLAPVGVCSVIDGMICWSAFMRDINSKKRYEASKKIYVIQSTTDEIVGYMGCGGFHSQIDGADKTITLFGFLHLGVIGLTGPLQYSLVARSQVDLPKEQKFVIS